jgi:2-oxoglutarate ferredoxin oxidoreductase subunit beta
VAQAVDWIPDVLFDIVNAAYHHKGFSFIRIIQRCPEFLPKMFEPWLHDPGRTLVLTHESGLKPSSEVSRIYRNQRAHDPSDIHAAREIASSEDPIPVGILYHDPSVPCYEDLRGAGAPRSPERTRAGLDAELDKYTIWPDGR